MGIAGEFPGKVPHGVRANAQCPQDLTRQYGAHSAKWEALLVIYYVLRLWGNTDRTIMSLRV